MSRVNWKEARLLPPAFEATRISLQNRHPTSLLSLSPDASSWCPLSSRAFSSFDWNVPPPPSTCPSHSSKQTPSSSISVTLEPLEMGFGLSLTQRQRQELRYLRQRWRAYGTRFFCQMHSQANAEMPRFAAEKGFIHGIAKRPEDKPQIRLREGKRLGVLRDKAEAWGAWGRRLERRKRNPRRRS